MAQFPGSPHIGRIDGRESPGHSGVFRHYDYLETNNFGRNAKPQSITIPDELKKRVEAAAKEFNFTTADIDRVEKAVQDQNSNRNSGKEKNLVQDDVKTRVAAAINKYKFTPEEIATVKKSVRDQKSMNSINHPDISYGNAFMGSDFYGFGAPCSGRIHVEWDCSIM